MCELTRAPEFEARVIAARLGSEGLLAEVRGVDPTYPSMSGVSVWVEESGLETAREILMWEDLAAAADDDTAAAPPALWFIVALFLLVAAFTLARVVAGS